MGGVGEGRGWVLGRGWVVVGAGGEERMVLGERRSCVMAERRDGLWERVEIDCVQRVDG